MTNGFQEIGEVDTASGLGADLRTAIESVERYEDTGQDLEVALGLLRGLLPNIEPPKVSERLERFATLELAPETQDSLDRDLREAIARLEAEAEAIWHDDWPYEEKDIWKPTQWLVPGWIPAGRVSLLSGEGAVGKTRVAMQIAAAVALGKPNAFLGETSLPLSPAFTGEPAPICWVSWETAPGDFQKRLRAANGISEDVSELRGWVRYKRASKPAWGVGEGARMATRGAQLSAGAKILEYAESIGTRLLVLDPLAGAFAGNENERPVVRAFLTWLSVWAERTGCTIIVLSHPPKTREAYSGSTDWRNGAQALLTLKSCEGEDCDLVILESDKVNEGRTPVPECFGWDERAYTFTMATPCEHIDRSGSVTTETPDDSDSQRHLPNMGDAKLSETTETPDDSDSHGQTRYL